MSKNKGFQPPSSTQDEGVAIPIPPHAGNAPKYPSLGLPTKWWIYNTKNGEPLLVVCRFIDPEGNKQDRPLTYRQYANGTCKWAWKSTPEPRILFNLDKIAGDAAKPILVCEGEKASEAASVLFPEFTVTTSPNGAKSPHKADWSPCAGRRVIIWPDNDDEGREYADKVAQLTLAAGATSAHIVEVPKSFPEKWDLADSPPEGVDITGLHSLIGNAKEALRPYDEATHAAQSLTASSSPQDIDHVLSLLPRLSTTEQERVKQIVSKTAKISLKVQNEALKELKKQSQNTEDEKVSQLDLARFIINELKSENILSTTAHLWVWREKGYWEAMPDLESKKLIQNYLEEYGQRVTRGLVDAVYSILKNEVFAEQHAWDLNPDIINVANGELHFENNTFIRKPHLRENYRTTQIPHEYLPTAECPRFIKFLDEVFEGDEDADEKKRSIMELIGYTLTNTTKFEKFILLIGSGGNGKSVILSIILALLGAQNVAAVQPSELSDKFKRAHLHKKLANIITEVAQGEVIADAELKAFTSGELVTADHKHQPPFSFTPYCTFWLGTNHMPRTKDFSDALYRRAIIFRFNNKFKKAEDIKNEDQSQLGHRVRKENVNLKKELLEELPGILRLALMAYAQVLQRGSFTEPKSSLQEKEAWRKSEDQVALFIDDCCILDAGAAAFSGDLFRAYLSWARNEGIKHTLSHKRFTARLLYSGCKKDKGTGGVRMIRGVKLTL